MFEIVAFTLFSALSISMFSITVFTSNTLYALSSLAAGMIFLSGFFFLLDAEFLGVVQIVVYSGAVMALYAFAMMFFDSLSDIYEDIKKQRNVFLLSGLSALILVVILIAPILGQKLELENHTDENLSNAVNIGQVIFTKYILVFELASIMLLLAMISAIVLASKNMDISYSELNEEKIDELESTQSKNQKEQKWV